MALLDGRGLSRPKALVRKSVRSLVRNSYPVRPWIPTFVRLREGASRPLLWVFLLIWCATYGLPSPAVGQTDVNDVHVVSREIQPKEVGPGEVETAKAEEVAKQSVVPASLNTRVRPLKVAVDLVLVPVAITAPMSPVVTGLEKENLQHLGGSSKGKRQACSSAGGSR